MVSAHERRARSNARTGQSERARGTPRRVSDLRPGGVAERSDATRMDRRQNVLAEILRSGGGGIGFVFSRMRRRALTLLARLLGLTFDGSIQIGVNVYAEDVAESFVNTFSRTGGLFFCEDGECRWWHESVAEYLAACALAKTSTVEKLRSIMKRWQEDAWQEVLIFLLGIISQKGPHVHASLGPSECVEEILQGANGDQAGLFLFLALGEGAALRPDVEDQLISSLIRNTISIGQFEECCGYVEMLERQGRSPIQILQRLSERTRVRNALSDLRCDSRLKEWMRKKAAKACDELGL